MNMDRRTLVQALGAAGISLTAGCLESSTEEQPEEDEDIREDLDIDESAHNDEEYDIETPFIVTELPGSIGFASYIDLDEDLGVSFNEVRIVFPKGYEGSGNIKETEDYAFLDYTSFRESDFEGFKHPHFPTSDTDEVERVIAEADVIGNLGDYQDNSDWEAFDNITSFEGPVSEEDILGTEIYEVPEQEFYEVESIEESTDKIGEFRNPRYGT